MNYTENLSLGLPEYGESADVADLNRNSGILDAYVYNSRQIECEPYDSTKTYMSGDLAIHNEVIYECNTDNTTGAWDDSKWDSTTLAEQIAKAKQSGGGQVTKEASGNPIELTDAASAPLVKCTTEIQGSQDLHGYDKPWVGGAGKNKLNAQDTTISGGFIFGDVIIALSAGTYTLSFNSTISGGQYQITIRNSSDSSIAVETGSLQQGSNSITFTISETSAKCSLYSNNTSSATYSNLQIETGSTATSFAPYSNICPITAYTEGEIEVSDGDGNVTTHTTTYPSAIYRGSEDVVNGEVTSGWISIDLGSLSWTYSSQYNRFSATLTDYKKPSSNTVPFNAICSCYETVGSNYTADSSYDSCIGANSGSDTLVVRDTRYTDATAFTSAVTGQTLAYELATPTTSSVTPTNLPIKSLSGYNHIESSTGDMEVEYITEEYQPLVDLIQSGNGHTYSTSEQVVGKWIDGKDLYEQTVVNSSTLVVGNNSISIPTDATSIISATGVFVSGSYSNPLNYYATSANGTLAVDELNATSHTLRVRIGSDYSSLLAGAYVYITIRYTKTTQTRSLSAPVTSQKAQIEPLTDKTEEVPTEEEKAVNEEENTNENR